MNSEEKAKNSSDASQAADEKSEDNFEEIRKVDIDMILAEFKKELESESQVFAREDAENQPDESSEQGSEEASVAPEDAEEQTQSEAAQEQPQPEDDDVQPQSETAEEPERDEEYERYYEKYYKRGTALDRLWRDRSNKTRAFLIILIVLIILVTGVAVFIDSKLDLINFIKPGGEETTSGSGQIVYDEEDHEMMSAIDEASSLKDYLYQWANNGGEIMSSKNVINVLLLGLDSKDGLENGGRSDVIMLASLNKKTKKINISSIYRDTWLYMNVDGSDRYTKLNASYFYGGPEGTIKTFEENLKIKIDFYVAVDFSSFTDIINALGGITLEVQEYEAKYINRTTVHTIEYGPAVKLDGWEALVFARIRHSDADSDVSRTRRQRQVITALIKELKNAGFSQINSAANALFKYVNTNLTRTQLVSYATQALAYRWMDYDITQTVLSDTDVFGTGWVGSASTVFVDMPLAAYRLQSDVFGESNIVLDANRVTIFDLTSSSGGSSSSSYTSPPATAGQPTSSHAEEPQEPEPTEPVYQPEETTVQEAPEPEETTAAVTTTLPTQEQTEPEQPSQDTPPQSETPPSSQESPEEPGEPTENNETRTPLEEE